MQEFETTASASTARPRSRSGLFFVALVAFLLGAVLVAWALTSGRFDTLLPRPDASQSALPENEATLVEPAGDPSLAQGSVDGSNQASGTPITQQRAADLGSVEGRLALIEDRISRIDFQTDAASSNAARAEGLLIAFAARRMVDRGEPLSYVADQLRLRFMDAQPRAVETVIAFSKEPVTIDELSARLEALSPELSTSGKNVSFWQKARSELSGMFRVRRDSAALVSPRARIERARIMLTARRIGSAVAEVQRLPGADAAKTWIADAQRYENVQKALNLLETTAMLEPRRLKDAEGHAIDQPSPLATPAIDENGDPLAAQPATPGPSAPSPSPTADPRLPN